MNNQYDESCNAYGPVPDEEDQYKPDRSAAKTWAFWMAVDAHRRDQQSENK